MSQGPIVVQKFGGTSVATASARRRVLEHVARERASGSRVAVVVSAMGRRGEPYATDTLLDLLREGGRAVDPQHYDLMFACGEMISAALMAHTLQAAGIRAVALSSAQAGIHTDGAHLEAEIVHVETQRLLSLLADDRVPVVTGGQGVAPGSLDFASLGRGGSDTSAVALGVFLGAERVDIFTDVEGVATIDPRVVPDARLLRGASYESMHEMTRFGAKVVHPRAVLTGWKGQTPVTVRSTFSEAAGTTIGNLPDEAPLVGIALLPAMLTRAAACVADETRRGEWERRHAVLSVVDATSGTVLAGAAADKRQTMEELGAASGGRVARDYGSCCWLSVVGESVAIREHTPICMALLEAEGVEVHGHEIADRRCTFVIPEAERERAARLIYDATFGGCRADLQQGAENTLST